MNQTERALAVAAADVHQALRSTLLGQPGRDCVHVRLPDEAYTLFSVVAEVGGGVARAR